MQTRFCVGAFGHDVCFERDSVGFVAAKWVGRCTSDSWSWEVDGIGARVQEVWKEGAGEYPGSKEDADCYVDTATEGAVSIGAG